MKKLFIFGATLVASALLSVTPLVAVTPAQAQKIQQFQQQLAPQQQAQVQAALLSEGINAPSPAETLAKPDTVVARAATASVSPRKNSALEALYAQRVVDNPQLARLSSGEAPFFRNSVGLPKAQMRYAQFGYDIFTQSSSLVAPPTRPVDDGYLLGPGDSLTVYLWGKLEERLDLTLDSSGTVLLPKSGPLQLSGTSFRESKRMIQQALAKHFVNFDIQVVFKERRNIQVYLLGQATKPGAFQIPAGTRLTGLLYLSQGPLREGSLRKIQILRNNRVVRTIDLYAYLLRGERNQDVVLENDDTVFIPPIGDTVLIGGAIAQPGIYEVGSHNTLADVAKFAAGLTWDYYYKRVQLYRIQTGEFQKAEDLIVKTPEDLAEKTKKLRLRDGDIVLFQPIHHDLRNVLTLVGNVVRPGHYQWQSGLTLSTLIDRAEGLLPSSLSRVDVYRFVTGETTSLITLNLNNEADRQFKLHEWDVVQIHSTSATTVPQSVSVQGAVVYPGSYPLLENMRLQDLLFVAKTDPLLRGPEVDIVRMAPNGKISLIEVKLDSTGQVSPNIPLQPSDDVRIKIMRNPKITVTISGEVPFPGTYTLTETSRLSDIVRRAGGVTREAYLPATVFTRTKLTAYEDLGYEKVVRDEQKRMMYDQLQMTAFSETEKQINEKILEARGLYIQQLRQSERQNQGRMVIDMSAVIKGAAGNTADLLLENGDTVVIPKMPDYVQLVGGVESPATYQYISTWTWSEYLTRAGGLSAYADRDKIRVFHVDGTVSKLGDSLRPGDIVYVPENIVVPFNWMFVLRSVIDVFKTVSDAAVSYLVIQGVVTGFK